MVILLILVALFGVFTGYLLTKRFIKTPPTVFIVNNEHFEFGAAQAYTGIDVFLHKHDERATRHLFTKNEMKRAGRRALKNSDEKQPSLATR